MTTGQLRGRFAVTGALSTLPTGVAAFVMAVEGGQPEGDS